MHDAVRRRDRRRRPTPVTILAAVQILSSAGSLVSALALAGAQLGALEGLANRGDVFVGNEEILLLAVMVGLTVTGVIGLAAAILLFRMRQLGWTLAMLLAGFSLASQIYLYVTAGVLTVHLMLLQVVIVLYLNQREVRAAFGIGEPDDGSEPELDERG